MNSANVRIVATHRGKSHATTADVRDLNPRTLCGRDAANMAANGASLPTCKRCAAKMPASVDAADETTNTPAPVRRAAPAAPSRDAVTVRTSGTLDGMSWASLRIAAYARLSRDDEDSASIAHQGDATDATAARYGGSVARTYTDDGLSGTLPLESRPGMAALVADIRAGLWDVVVARHSDRYARDEYQMRRLANVCRVNDVMLWSVEEGALLDEDGTLNMAALTASFVNALYTKGGSKKARDSKATMRKQGRWAFGRAPLGYRVVPATVNGVHGKYLAEDAPYADMIRDAIKRVIDGTRVQTIVDEWNAAGVLSRDERQRELYGRDPFMTRDGRRKPKVLWDASTVKNVLTSPRLLGYLLWDDTPTRQKTDENGKRIKRRSTDMEVYRDEQGRPVTVTVDGTGIVDAETLARVRHELLEVRAVKTSGYETRTALRGIAVCGSCGGALTRNGHKSGKAGGYTYRCKNRGCERRVSIAGPALEEHVAAEFLAVWGDVRLWRDVESGDAEGARAALRAAEERLETLADRMADPSITGAALDVLTVNLGRVSAEVDALRAEVDVKPTVTRTYDAETIGERWARGDVDVRRAIMRELGVVARVAPGKGRWSVLADRVDVRATSEFAGFILDALSAVDA